MGLYESELTKQIHLRNKQRKEWEAMKKKMAWTEEQTHVKKAQEQQLLDQEHREEERTELEETRASKKVTAAMVETALGGNIAESLQKIVEVLQNQNGTNKEIIQRSF